MQTAEIQKKIPLRAWVLTWALIAVLTLASILLRIPGQNRLYVNEDATWHVLHTMTCYDGIPASEHLFLPLVTPNDDARGLAWGATVPGENGIYYYTSFWPAGFVVPWLFAKLFGLAHVPGTLYALNSLIYAGCAVLCALVFLRLFRGKLHPCLCVLLAAGVYLFQPEILQSQGAVYWHHSLNQLLLLAQLYCFARFERKGARIAFFILCFCTPFVEWTGFVANAGYAAALFFFGAPAEEKRPMRGRFAQAAIVGGATVLSLCITVGHYLQRLAPAQLWSALTGSYAVRGDADRDPLLQLFVMYFRSFRAFWILLGALLVLVLVLSRARRALPALVKEYGIYLLVTLAPMLENLALRQHTMEYSYARMKGVTPMLLVFFVLVCCLQAQWPEAPRAQKRLAAGLCAAVLACGMYGLATYLHAPNRYVEVINYAEANSRFARQILDAYPREDSFYGTSVIVRGYTNELFEGGIMELTDYMATTEECRARGKRYAIFIEANWATSNTYEFTAAHVWDSETGESVQLFAPDK